jgi:hypothetical protein
MALSHGTVRVFDAFRVNDVVVVFSARLSFARAASTNLFNNISSRVSPWASGFFHLQKWR